MSAADELLALGWKEYPDHLTGALAQLNRSADWNKRTGGILSAKLNCFEAQDVLTALQELQLRAERAELALANAQCPHVVGTNEGTHYCAVAESTVAEARKDSERFNLLASLLEDVNIGDIDPTKHRTEDNEWPDAWRNAIDAAMTNSNHKTT